MHKSDRTRGPLAKIAVVLVVLACVGIGLVGIVLPVIPGLLFLALAALIAARHVPWIDSRLRRHAVVGPHMHRVDRVSRLSLADQLRVGALMTVKFALDGLDRLAAWVSKRDGTRR